MDDVHVSEQVAKVGDFFLNADDETRQRLASVAIADALFGIHAELRDLRIGRDEYIESTRLPAQSQPSPHPGWDILRSGSTYSGPTFSTSGGY